MPPSSAITADFDPATTHPQGVVVVAGLLISAGAADSHGDAGAGASRR
ncbi:hypothetical protein [Saccharopolyspora sp. NPDC050642]